MQTTFKLQEQNAYNLSFQLVDENGADLSLSSIDALLLTLYYTNPRLETGDQYHLGTINSRVSQDVKNSNNVEVSSSGAVTWSIQPADNEKLDSLTEEEIHIALFTWQYSTTKQNSQEFILNVKKVQYSET